MNGIYKHVRMVAAAVTFALCLVSIGAVQAQGGEPATVTGKVYNQAGAPLAGVTVVVKGTTKGTVTMGDGTFSISAAPEQTLEFNSLGYTAVEVAVGKRTDVSVTMEEDAQAIDEVVVVAYGEQRKVNLTGAVGVVDRNALESRPVLNAVEAIQGTTPGLIIEQSNSAPGSRPSINIRGINTMNDNNPLVIIDGIEGDIQNVGVNDIESISVLKDASSTAIYGSRASNGIILITTYKGNSTRNEVNYNFNYGWQSPTALPNVVDSWVHAEMYNETLANSGGQPKFSAEEIYNLRNGGPNERWIDKLYHVAPTQQHSLSLSGGNKNTTYMVAGNFLDQNSMWVGPGYGFTRYGTRTNIVHQIKDFLKFTATASFTHNEVNEPSKFKDQIVRQSVRMPSYYSIKDENGDWSMAGGNSNAFARLWEGGYIRDKHNDLNGTFRAELKIIDGLTLSGMVGGRYNTLHRHNQAKSINYAFVGAGDAVNSKTRRLEQTTKLTSDAILNYSKVCGKHSFGAMAGLSYEGLNFRWEQTMRDNLEDADMQFEEMGILLSGDNISNSSNGNDWSLYSAFGRFNYNYAERYLFEFNIRNDWSSKFKQGNRSGLFPSFSLGWRISEEKFFEPAKDYVSELKLRGSWGLVGNNRIDNYLYQENVSENKQGYIIGGQPVTTSQFSVANQYIGWETTRMFDIGIDAGLFSNRLSLSFDYFNNLTRDILVDLPVSTIFDSSGKLTQNSSKVLTHGWELAASYRFKTGKWNHRFTANVSDSQNKVIDNKGVVDIIGEARFQTIIEEGYPLWSYYGYKSDGFYQNEEEVMNGAHPSGITPKPGDIRYVDQDGNNEITEADRVVIGNRYPRYTFGFTYSLEWKGIDFSMFWQGVGKRQVWLAGVATQAFANSFEGPVFDYHLDRWNPGNTDASYPRLTSGAESNNNALRSDFWLENASYLRLKNVTLGYTFPANLTRKVNIQNLRVYASVQNALTFNKMRGGWDPEVSQNDASIYPVARVVSIGLNVKF